MKGDRASGARGAIVTILPDLACLGFWVGGWGVLEENAQGSHAGVNLHISERTVAVALSGEPAEVAG